MKIAIIGSRGLSVNIEDFVTVMPEEIISGGAKGIDSDAAKFALSHGIKLTEIRPNYDKYGIGAPHIRNREIVSLADKVIALWDGKSKGTESTIKYARKMGKPIEVHII